MCVVGSVDLSPSHHFHDCSVPVRVESVWDRRWFSRVAVSQPWRRIRGVEKGAADGRWKQSGRGGSLRSRRRQNGTSRKTKLRNVENIHRFVYWDVLTELFVYTEVNRNKLTSRLFCKRADYQFDSEMVYCFVHRQLHLWLAVFLVISWMLEWFATLLVVNLIFKWLVDFLKRFAVFSAGYLIA